MITSVCCEGRSWHIKKWGQSILTQSSPSGHARLKGMHDPFVLAYHCAPSC